MKKKLKKLVLKKDIIATFDNKQMNDIVGAAGNSQYVGYCDASVNTNL
jgi:hypothetical protein